MCVASPVMALDPNPTVCSFFKRADKDNPALIDRVFVDFKKENMLWGCQHKSLGIVVIVALIRNYGQNGGVDRYELHDIALFKDQIVNKAPYHQILSNQSPVTIAVFMRRSTGEIADVGAESYVRTYDLTNDEFLDLT